MEIYAFPILIGIAVVEAVLSLTWNHLYFTIGVPVLRIELPAFSPGAPAPTPEDLTSRLHELEFPPIAFRLLNEDRYAFREKVWIGLLRSSYTPVMHGLLEFDRERAVVRVTGLLNWSTVAFSAVVLPFVLSGPVPLLAMYIFPVFLAVLLAVIYSIQRRRFREVATTAVSQWSGELQGSER